MQIENLKVFCDIVETGSFSRAAERNFVSQSAVSQQIRSLETKFRRKLIERGRGEAQPTEAGRIFYARAKAILARFGRMEDELLERTGGITGTVRVAAINSVGVHEMPPYIKRFITGFPNATIDLSYSRADQVYELILNGSVDVGIVAYPEEHPQIEVIPFRDDQLLFVCSPENPLAQLRVLPIGKLEGERFVAFGSSVPTRKAIDRILAEAAVSVKTVMEFDDIEMIKRMVEVDAGVSILPDFAIAAELGNKTLRALPFAGKKFYRPIAIIRKRDGNPSPAATKFVELLTAE